ncbi:MAG: DASS family sodium-coupled anion symporter [Phycisphaerales bacterium]|nr:DASS family sodium-coupled anion symporter [Phycisphaerales bacterium]
MPSDPTLASPNPPAGRRAGLLRAALIVLGPVFALAMYALLGALANDTWSLAEPARRTAAIATLVAWWWLSEALPLPATSLVPFVALPWLGVMSPTAAAAPYAHPVIFLFMGGFMMALAMERWGLHRRIALTIMLGVGSRQPMLVAGFMIASALLSMWISNIATTVMMLPTVLSVIGVVEQRIGKTQPQLAIASLLGIAYAASIGGIATPIGTAPNGILLGVLNERFGFEVAFAHWMMLGAPLALVMLVVTWLLLTRFLHPLPNDEIPGGRDFIRQELRALGKTSHAERIVMYVFFCAVFLWIFRKPLEGAVPILAALEDSTVAIIAALALFIIPVDLRNRVFTLDWETAVKLPWGVLLLFGGGFSLASAFKASALDQAIGDQFAQLGHWPTWALVLAVTGVIVFLTELTSNTATATIFVTLLAGIAVGLGVDPLLLCVPAAIGASFAFMLPVATPPNAVVFGSGRLHVMQMARAGILLNLIGIALLTVAAFTIQQWTIGTMDRNSFAPQPSQTAE